MARILVATGTGEAPDWVSVLASSGHELKTLTLPDGETAAEALTADIRREAPELVVAPYVPQDALSVKVMQQMQMEWPHLPFLFITGPDLPREHMIMAMNEGAFALVPEDAPEEALLNYVNRAMTTRRRRLAEAEELERCRGVLEQEKSCTAGQALLLARERHLIRQLSGLINRLLAAGPPRRKPKVLLVSDSAFQVDLFRKALEDHNFQVAVAADGPSGLAAAREDKPRIIVSDLEMPGLNGLELCRAVKGDESLSPNHFIICTANENRVEAVMDPVNKVDDCLIKPSRPIEYQEFVARVALGILD